MMDHRRGKRGSRETGGADGINHRGLKVSRVRVLVVEIFWRHLGWIRSVRDRV